MKYSKLHPLLKPLSSSLINMPLPSSISFNWNYGFLLGMTLSLQIASGLISSFHYTPNHTLAFYSLIMTSNDIPNLWLIHWTHANGASLSFLLLYLHIGRGLYFSAFKNTSVWLTGMIIFILSMITAFLGYVLPWGQMSYWGVTVITNLLSILPYIGPDIIIWLWGDFTVNNSTLKRFYSLHFLLPILILAVVVVHLLFLHNSGSTNPLQLKSTIDMSPFHPYFTAKDTFSLMMILILLLYIILMKPTMLNDPENFTLANPMMAPLHIQPEWYFLFAYAILRSIPNKMGGVLALLLSISIFLLPPLLTPNKIPLKLNPIKKLSFWMFLATFAILTWIGSNPVSPPFPLIGKVFSILYFLLSFILFIPN